MAVDYTQLGPKLLQTGSVDDLIEKFYFGDMKSFLSPENIESLFMAIADQFPDIASYQPFG